MYGSVETLTTEELEAERRYLADLDRIAEYDARIEMQAAALSEEYEAEYGEYEGDAA